MFNAQYQKALQPIMEYYRRTYKPQVLVVPSARFGIYVTVKTCFWPGDKVIVSPISCRTVLHALRAAGVVPIFVDIDPDCGNIHVPALSRQSMEIAKGIITTNLYGQPDNAVEIRKLAGRYGMLMIEDCAHVIDSSIDGRRIGTIGDVSVFSFKKYFQEPGGVVCTNTPDLHQRIAKNAVAEMQKPSTCEEGLRLLQLWLKKRQMHGIEKTAKYFYRQFGLANHQEASDDGNSTMRPADSLLTEQFDKKRPTTATLKRVGAKLAQADGFVAHKRATDMKLIKHCGLEYMRPGYETSVTHLVVPFRTQNREAIKERVKREYGIPTWFIYNPPLNQLLRGMASGYADESDPEKLAYWCQHILPINSAFSTEYLSAIRTIKEPQREPSMAAMIE